jgi:hypothetical protein
MVMNIMRFLLLMFSLIKICAVCADEIEGYVGIGATYLQHSNLITETRRDGSVDFQIGLSRQIAHNWRLGTGIDFVAETFSQVENSGNLLTWRTMSLDYQLSESWAANFYVGMSRFYRERPAYGYGAGTGIKYQIFNKWTLACDLNWTEVDTSTGVPRAAGSHQRDTLNWLNVTLLYFF